MGGDVAAIACTQSAVHGLAVELGEENVRDGMEHGFRRAFEQVRHPHVEFALAKTDGVVDGDKGIEANMERWDRRTGPLFAIGLLKDFCELKGHVEGRVARNSAVGCQHMHSSC